MGPIKTEKDHRLQKPYAKKKNIQKYGSLDFLNEVGLLPRIIILRTISIPSEITLKNVLFECLFDQEATITVCRKNYITSTMLLNIYNITKNMMILHVELKHNNE